MNYELKSLPLYPIQENRDVAQLVAHYVRDVGVACSSHVIPTTKRECINRHADF